MHRLVADVEGEEQDTARAQTRSISARVSVTVREGTTFSARWEPDRNNRVSAKWLPPGGTAVFLGNSLDETRTRTKDNHGRLSGPSSGRRWPVVEEFELPAGNSQGEVDRLPAGNEGTSRSRPCADALVDVEF
jgi:hypothetical protein